MRVDIGTAPRTDVPRLRFDAEPHRRARRRAEVVPAAAPCRAFDIVALPGLAELWRRSTGDPRICVALLDGPADLCHPSLAAADLAMVETTATTPATGGAAFRHGTHVASIVFGRHGGPVPGIAPGCRGVILPIFADGPDGGVRPCSQLDLARAILQALQCGAQVISISGGELSATGTAHPILTGAIERCARADVLVIAAAGNEGCDCLHVPGALPGVLAVGAMTAQGLPAGFSNWGSRYGAQGILAPGQDILGAAPGGGTAIQSGTSYATPIVAGIAALLLGLQLAQGRRPSPSQVRAALLDSATGCDGEAASCRRFLAGRLNPEGATMQITTATDEPVSHEQQEPGPRPAPTAAPREPVAGPARQVGPPEGRIHASGCGGADGGACSCGATQPQLAFPLGSLGFDFGSEARRDSIQQHMAGPGNPHDPAQLLAYLESNPWDAASILWTLSLDATPIYVVQARGAFADLAYRRLGQFLAEQVGGEVERVSIPGQVAGSARLMSGQVLPVLWAEPRGMYSWTTAALLGEAGRKPGRRRSGEGGDGADEAVANFLRRVYDELRNLGLAPQERALNYAATNAFQVAQVFADALRSELELDTIAVERSPICRPDSDCWDVRLIFFNPRKLFEQARKVYRFTVDVSDVVPVMVGPVRSWSVR
ncbi:MAG: S8 family serine peptidase [Dongiaceae bacterium]